MLLDLDFPLKLSEKGLEQLPEGGFGHHEEAEMGRSASAGRSVELCHEHPRGFSDRFFTEFCDVELPLETV